VKGLNPPVLLFPFANGIPSTPVVKAENHGSVSFGFTFMPDNTIILTDAAPYGNFSGIIALTPATSSITFVQQNYFLIPGQHAACWVTISQKTNNLYVSNAGSDAISILSYTSGTFSVIGTTPFTFGGLTDTTIANVSGVEFLYVVSSANMSITAVNPTTYGIIKTTSFGGIGGSHAIGLASYVVQSGTTSTSTTSGTTGTSTTSGTTSTSTTSGSTSTSTTSGTTSTSTTSGSPSTSTTSGTPSTSTTSGTPSPPTSSSSRLEFVMWLSFVLFTLFIVN